MVGCWFFTSGPVSLSAKIERKGYCNGKSSYLQNVNIKQLTDFFFHLFEANTLSLKEQFHLVGSQLRSI